jgi:outer membrane protein insertion porin family
MVFACIPLLSLFRCARSSAPRMNYFLGVLPALLSLTLVLPVAAQESQSSQNRDRQSLPRTPASTEQMLGSYEGQEVASIDIAGRPHLSTAQFEPLFAQKAGEPFSKQKVLDTVAALRRQGHFQQVRLEVDPDPRGVRVLLILEPAVYLGIYRFPGASVFSYSRLLQVANYPVQTPYSAPEVERGRQALLNFYRQQGYFRAEIRTELDVDQGHDIANVQFETTLGRKAKFGDVIIAGLPNDKDHSLEKSLKGFLARVREAAIRRGKPYHYATLTRARTYLEAELQKRGLLSAQVQLAGADFHASTNRADIHFAVDPGTKVQVNVAGAHLWGWDKKDLLPMYQGLGVDPETVQEGKQALTSYFQKKGYFDVRVNAEVQNESTEDRVLYRIAREKKHKVKAVKVAGNSLLKASELMPQIAVEKQHLLSRGKFSQDLLRKSVNNLKAVYQSEGFSRVQVAPEVKKSGGNLYVTFVVTEGPRDVVAALTVEGADTFPASRYAPHGLKTVAGQPYSGAHVVADRTEIMANYLKAGYLTASFRETATAVSKRDPHQIDVVYHIEEGPRVRTGDVLTLGREHTRQSLINKDVTELKPGQPLTETALLTAGSRLYDHTGVFDWAEVDPKRQITTQTVDDVLVKVHEAKRNSMTYGFGFEVINRGGSIPSGTVALPNLPPIGLPPNFRTSETTFYGPRGTFEYTRNNVRGKAESLSLTAFAGRLDQRFAAYYLDPTFRWTLWKTTTSLSYEKNEENPIFSSQQELAALQIQRALDKAQKDILFFRYGYSYTNITHVLIAALVPEEDRSIRLSTLAANLTRDTRDNPLDEHRGGLDSIEFDFNTSQLGSNVDFAKLTGQVAIYREKFHHIVWADSIRIGLAQPFNNSFVPLSQAFFTGGGNSLRGFPLDGAGPQNTVLICPSGAPSCSNPAQISVPAGGNEELIINSEARIPLPIKKGLSVVPFYDGGNVFPRIGFHDFTSLYSNNVGVGLRYATPVGPIRIDVGQNLNPVNGIKSTNYFISIGQAF